MSAWWLSVCGCWSAWTAGFFVGLGIGLLICAVVLRLLVDSWSKRSERLVLFYPTKEGGR